MPTSDPFSHAPPAADRPAIQPEPNPLLRPASVRSVKPDDIRAQTRRTKREDNSRRRLLKLFRRETAADFLGEIAPGFHRWGLTKGQFSLVDVLQALAERTGPAHLALSTWTAGKDDLRQLEGMIRTRLFLSLRFLIDFSFVRRQPALIGAIRKSYGLEAIVLTRVHCKFATVTNEAWHIVVRTSMNLNFNARLEDVEVKDDPELCQFLTDIMDELFRRHDSKAQATKPPREVRAEFGALD